MTPRTQALLTWSLAALCLLIAFASRAPHLRVRSVTIERVQPELRVAIEGEVRSPGVYTLPWGSRVEALVTAAGGLTPAAEASLVNLADPLTQGEAVVVPGPQSTVGEGLVDLNGASPLELEQLPGIGPALAGRIVAARPYARLEDLLRVAGIGERTLERLRGLVTL
jgi:competence protein ComEA